MLFEHRQSGRRRIRPRSECRSRCVAPPRADPAGRGRRTRSGQRIRAADGRRATITRARPAARRVGRAGEGRRRAAAAVVGLAHAAAVGRPHAHHARRRSSKPDPETPLATVARGLRRRAGLAGGQPARAARRRAAAAGRRARRAAGMAAARIEFLKGDGRRYRARCSAPTGWTSSSTAASYNRVGGPAGELPHDLAHLIVEDELGLRSGVWGVLVAGGMFGHATVVAGRRKPHATRRGQEVIARAGDQIMQAEMLTRAVCDLCAADGVPTRRPSGAPWASAGGRSRSRAPRSSAPASACATAPSSGRGWPRARRSPPAGACRRPPDRRPDRRAVPSRAWNNEPSRAPACTSARSASAP